MTFDAEFRHPKEWTDLSIAILIALLFVAVISVLTWGMCCLWGAFGLLLAAFMAAVHNSHLRNTARKVTRGDDADLHGMAEEAARKVGIDLPEVYVSGADEVNAYTRGVLTPVIVLNVGLLDRMDRDEVMFVLGHEMGHIRLRHYAIQTVLGSPGAGVPWIVYLPLLAFRVLFLRGKLSRSMEYSADRAGLIACGSIEGAVSTMIKLGSGRAVTRDQVRGVIDGRMRIDGDRDIIGAILSTHPDLDDRVKELVRFAGGVH